MFFSDNGGIFLLSGNMHTVNKRLQYDIFRENIYVNSFEMPGNKT